MFEPQVKGENKTVNVKRLPKKPAPKRFGRKLSAAQQELATHICVDCGYIYCDPCAPLTAWPTQEITLPSCYRDGHGIPGFQRVLEIEQYFVTWTILLTVNC
jgi:hypothetical protein